jgi:hypothetical protein
MGFGSDIQTGYFSCKRWDVDAASVQKPGITHVTYIECHQCTPPGPVLTFYFNDTMVMGGEFDNRILSDDVTAPWIKGESYEHSSIHSFITGESSSTAGAHGHLRIRNDAWEANDGEEWYLGAPVKAAMRNILTAMTGLNLWTGPEELGCHQYFGF